MKKLTKAFVAVFCIFSLLSTLLALTSCDGLGNSQSNPTTSTTTQSPVINLTDTESVPYVIITPRHTDSEFEEVLEVFQQAVESRFGVRFERYRYAPLGEGGTAQPSPDTEGESGSGGTGEGDGSASPDTVGKLLTTLATVKRAIFFGNTGASHACVRRSLALLGYEGQQGYENPDALPAGFAVAVGEDCLSMYAHSSATLSDMTELFITRYMKGESGALSVDRDIALSRPFTECEIVDGVDYGFGLPVISVTTEGGQKITSTTEYVRGSVKVSNVYSELSMNEIPVSIRGRGNGTWDTTTSNKLPYKLKFDSKVNLLGIGNASSDEWALLSNPLDYSQLRNAVAFTLAKRLFTNIPFVSSFTYVNLFISGKYAGVYLLCEQVEDGKHKIKVDENGEDMTRSEYLIELDQYATKREDAVRNVDYFYLEDKYWVIDSKLNTEERCSYVKSKLKALFTAIEKGDTDALASLMDMDSCVDMYLLHEYTKNTDVGWSSFYMVLRADGRFEFTAPWDFDLSSGNDPRIDNGSWEGLYVGRSDNLVMQSNPIFYKLMKLDFFVSAVTQRWNELSPLALETVKQTAEHYSSSHLRDFVIDCKHNYKPNKTYNYSGEKEPEPMFKGNVSYLLTWYEGRQSFMDGYFAVKE